MINVFYAAYTGAITWWVLPTQEQLRGYRLCELPLAALAAFIFLPLPSRYRLCELPLLAVMQRLSYQGGDSICLTWHVSPNPKKVRWDVGRERFTRLAEPEKGKLGLMFVLASTVAVSRRYR